MPGIDSDSLEEIKSRIKATPISHIVRHYLKLIPQGDNLLGLCPFHKDTNPSLRVNDRKNLFKCFACDSAGDAIAFVQKFNSITFVEAVREIGKLLGIDIDELFGRKDIDKRAKEARALLKEITSVYRREALSGKWSYYQEFIKNRRITAVTAERFEMGYAAEQSVLNYLAAKFPTNRSGSRSSNPAQIASILANNENTELAKNLELIKDLGLIKASKHSKDTYYETFRNRIIFPIKDIYGEIVGFSSRATSSSQHAKYLNSPESFIFNKRNILYGLNLAKQRIKEHDQVILVEGHMDLITLHQAGFENSVAMMGVALSNRSINTLKFLTKNFVLGLDTDQAGWKAMERVNKDLMAQGIMAKYIEFSPYKDPDEFLNKSGSDSATQLAKRIKNAPKFIDILIDRLIPSPIPTETDQKLSLLNTIFEHLSPLKVDLAATERIIQIANRIGLQTPSFQLLEIYKEYLHSSEATHLPVSDVTSAPNMPSNHKKPLSTAGTRPLSSKKSELSKSAPKSNSAPESSPLMVSSPTLSSSLTSGVLPSLSSTTNFVSSTVLKRSDHKLTRAEKGLIQELILHPECLQHEQLPEILEYVEYNEVNRLFRWLKKFQSEILDTEYATTVINYLTKENYSLPLRELIGSTLFNYQYQPELVLDSKHISKLIKDLLSRLKREKLLTKRDELLQQQKNCQKQDEVLPIISELIIIDKQLNNIKIRNF